MIIEVVTFTVPIENKEHFQKKIEKKAAVGLAPGCIDEEIWINEAKEAIEYVIVSKWNDKKDYRNWMMANKEHAEEHRKMNQYYKDHPEIQRPKIVKKVKSYELYQS
ncbi:MAG: antibiotic biosynthesis monooxygenase [Syntrophomonadaceae bacterium]|jgi:heme-degrading monooxygenase HmoA|nr:antibiotic biosynthesis monooxygenase [Syntrophomonadaceae bacterium]